MKHAKSNHKGFAAIEAVLILVAVAIIGGTGYYVYHANKKATSTYNSASKTASAGTNSQPNGGKGGGGPNTGPAKTEIFLIPEWKLSAEIPAPPEQAGLIQYKITQQNGQETAQFSTQELKDADPACAVDQTPAAGFILRAKATDHLYLDDGTDSGQTIQKSIASGVIKSYKKVSNYYYIYQHPQGLCGASPTIPQLQQAAVKSVQSIAAKLTAE